MLICIDMQILLVMLTKQLTLLLKFIKLHRFKHGISRTGGKFGTGTIDCD